MPAINVAAAHAEPWEIGEDGEIITAHGSGYWHEDAPRIVDCVNAFTGMQRPTKLPDLLDICGKLTSAERGDIGGLMPMKD